MQLSTWQKLIEAAGTHAKPIGDSPGGVASQLGISRQAVHGLIRRGTLDTVEVYDGTKLAFYVIPQPSVDAYKQHVVESLQRRLQVVS